MIGQSWKEKMYNKSNNLASRDPQKVFSRQFASRNLFFSKVAAGPGMLKHSHFSDDLIEQVISSEDENLLVIM